MAPIYKQIDANMYNSLRIGNLAVIDQSVLRPIALRPHLSISLPRKLCMIMHIKRISVAILHQDKLIVNVIIRTKISFKSTF
ncbi:hypothetical protein SPSIL_039670 [Sporomusa silvacetica DSM 10669]|uniref:Uncharacterized protein n=1 Tax=Sporomusa silvacetica DSM 10669 TaxID=1123289 RepID=A0ABZ3IQL3_9FIRM|nr:hypothetical protein SPSIL_38350 [Sporomusa silvacetica DSM 10669]